MKNYIPLVVAAVLLAGGCGKKEEARPVAPQPPLPSLMKPGDPLPPVAPTPLLPAPNAPKPEAPLPQAGQAGDHSSPAFKGGGAPDKK